MKIAFTSDIHGDHSRQNEEILPSLAQSVQDSKPDVFIIVGDAACGAESVGDVLGFFRHLEVKKCFVPGNHDLWVSSKRAVRRGEDSGFLYRKLLPECCEKNDFHYLPGHPFALDCVAFVGSAGWYDYSLSDPRLEGIYAPSSYDSGEFMDPRYEQGYWNDMRYVQWLKNPGETDWRQRKQLLRPSEICDYMFEQFREDVERILEDERVLIAAVHTSGFAESVRGKERPDPFRAYAGSRRYGDYLRDIASGRQVYYLCGHEHSPFKQEASDVHIFRNPVGCLNESDGNLEELARQRITTIEC